MSHLRTGPNSGPDPPASSWVPQCAARRSFGVSLSPSDPTQGGGEQKRRPPHQSRHTIAQLGRDRTTILFTTIRLPPVAGRGRGGGYLCVYIYCLVADADHFMNRLFHTGAASFCSKAVFGQKKCNPSDRWIACLCTAMSDCCVWWNLRWLLRFLCLVKLVTVTARGTRGVKVPLLAVSLSPA